MSLNGHQNFYPNWRRTSCKFQYVPVLIKTTEISGSPLILAFTRKCSDKYQVMRTLVLDTSGPYTTVLITRDDELSVANVLRDRPAEHLHEQIHTALISQSVSPHDLDQIGIVIGPGSWTGLNIGVTAAKTFAQVLNVPLLPIRTLDALVANSLYPTWGLMNAGRNRCYYARYSASIPHEMAVNSMDFVIKQIKADSAHVLEYGDTFKDQFLDHDRYHSVTRLQPESLIVAMKFSPSLDGDSIKAITPAYLQPSHVEHDASH